MSFLTGVKATEPRRSNNGTQWLHSVWGSPSFYLLFRGNPKSKIHARWLLLTEKGSGCFGGLEEFAGRDALVVGVDGHVGEGALQRVEPGPAWGDLNWSGHVLCVGGQERDCGEEIDQVVRFMEFSMSFKWIREQEVGSEEGGICPELTACLGLG